MTTARTSNGWAGIAGLAPESVLDQLASEGPTEIAVTQGMDAKVALPGVAGAASRLGSGPNNGIPIAPEM